MAVADDLQERERQAGNAEDSYDPGQQHYDEQFNHIAKAEEDRDFDQIIADNYGDGARGEKIDSHGDKIQRNYNADSDEDRESVREKEEHPDSLYKTSRPGSDNTLARGFLGKLGAGSKRFGPSGGIIGLLLFGIIGLGGGSTFLASSLLINIKEVFHNDRADATRVNNFFSRASLSYKMGKNAGTGCGKIAIKCKLSTFSEKQLQDYQKYGFTLEGEELDETGKPTGRSIDQVNADAKEGKAPQTTGIKRYKIKSITFPDSTKVVDASSFYGHTQAYIQMRIRAVKAFNPKASFYNNKKFDAVLNKFHLSKGSAFDGKTKKELDDGFNRQTDGDTEENNTDPERKKQKIEEKENDLKTKAGKYAGKVDSKALAAVQAACATYNIGRMIVTGAKIERVIKLIQFAFPWFQAADQIKDQGTISPEKVDYLSSRLTYYENNKTIEGSDPLQPELKDGDKNPKYNLSATDSQGYRIAAHGDTSALTEFAKSYLVGGNGLLKTMDGVIDNIQTFAGFGNASSGRGAIRTACRVANSSLVDWAEAIGCVVASVTIVGGAICIAVNKGIELAVQEAAERLVKEFAPLIIENLAKMNLGSDTKGVDAGNAMAAGAGLLLGTTATGYGLQPAQSAEQVSEYTAFTDQINNEYVEVARYEARDHPFDMTDEYSFLGSIVKKMNPQDIEGAPVLTGIANMFKAFSATTKSLAPNADALYSQPSLLSDARLKECDDKDLKSIGAIGDKFCNIVAIMQPSELQVVLDQSKDKNKSIDELIDWMHESQDKNEQEGGTLDDTTGCDDDCKEKSRQPSIDDNGAPIPDSQYDKFLKNCTDERLGETGAYWGTTDMAVEEGSDRDQAWATGEECLHDSKMLRNFRAYTNYCLQNGTNDGTSNCYTDDVQSLANTSTETCSPNGDTKAIYTCALKYDNYRYKWGGGHGDVPNATEWIKEFKAGKIPEWTPILDCSGLVRMAFVEAMGIEDQAYTAPDGYKSSKYWQPIALKDAQQGDIVTSDGHVAIVESNDPSKGEFKIFDAETESGPKENNIQHNTQTYRESFGAYRAKKG